MASNAIAVIVATVLTGIAAAALAELMARRRPERVKARRDDRSGR